MVEVQFSKARARFAAGFAVLLLVACDSACENAKEKFEEDCRDEIETQMEVANGGRQVTWGSDECNEEEECVANCLNDADCDAIAYVIANGVDDAPRNPRKLASCIKACRRSGPQAEGA